MTREELDALVADSLAEEFDRLRGDLEARIDRGVAARPIPPFTPPPIWTEGAYGAGATVRAHGGIFYARRDTSGHPGDDDGAWLPLVVGLAGFDMRWTDERTVRLFARLSDGTVVESVRSIEVPIVRGYWDAETDYAPGDRVFRYGEFHATAPSRGVDPTLPGWEASWLKVGGRHAARALALVVDDDGTIREGGKAIGSLRPLFAKLLDELLAKHLKPAA